MKIMKIFAPAEIYLNPRSGIYHIAIAIYHYFLLQTKIPLSSANFIYAADRGKI